MPWLSAAPEADAPSTTLSRPAVGDGLLRTTSELVARTGENEKKAAAQQKARAEKARAAVGSVCSMAVAWVWIPSGAWHKIKAHLAAWSGIGSHLA